MFSLDDWTHREGSVSKGVALCLVLMGSLAVFRLQVFLGLRRAVYWLQSQHKKRNANKYLKGNFAPIGVEAHEQELKVIGTLPEGFKGAYVRTGPNPLLTPAGNYHWFDGDGMLHACRFKDGKVSYCNRFIETNRMTQEKKIKAPVFGKFGDIQGVWGLVHLVLDKLAGRCRVFNNQHGDGVANTALVFHAKRLLSLHEGDLPYAVKVACNGLIETIGRVLDGEVSHHIIAHPKKDPDTGELFCAGYRLQSQPHVIYTGLDAEGQVMFDCPVHIPGPVMMHDMQITADYAIIMDTCMEFKPQAMVKSGGLPFSFNFTRPSRFGIIDKHQPRGSTSPAKARWFELEPLQIFHTINAWQEGPLVRLFTCYMPSWDMAATNPDSILLAELTFNMDTGEASKRDFAPGITAEFPKVPAHMQGRKTRYAYLAEMDPEQTQKRGVPVMPGLVKLDLSLPGDEAVVGRIVHGDNTFGGEAFFVPAHEDPSQCQSEDDGYLVSFVHNESALDHAGSELVIYDARSFSSQAVARIRMPQRVPYGFHSTWVPEAEFQQQWEASGLPGVYPTAVKRPANGKVH